MAMIALDLSDSHYLLLSAHRHTVAQAQQLLAKLPYLTHFVVQREEQEQVYYYLYRREELETTFAFHQPTTPLMAALNLHEWQANPALPPDTPADDLSGRAIILEEGQPIAFYDSTHIPSHTNRHTPHDPDSPRNLVTELPQTLEVGQTASLLVYLSTLTLDPTAPALPLTAGVGTKLEVVVQARQGVELVGEREGQLTVTSEEESLPLQFKLKALTPGRAWVRVLPFVNQVALGAVDLRPEVVTAARPGSTHQTEQPIPHLTISQPDLSLLIFENQQTLTFRLTAADVHLKLNFQEFGPVPLRSNPHSFVRDFFKDLENTPITHPEAAAQRLGRVGAGLYEALLPEPLRDLLWGLRERITTIQIQSQEPWFPWEVCKMTGREQGRVVEGGFLAEQYEVTRWLMGIPQHLQLSLTKLAVVAQTDGNLPAVAAEKAYLHSLAQPGRVVTEIPTTYADVTSALSQGVYDGWHFSGHGIFENGGDPNRSQLRLTNFEELTPQDLSGVVQNLGVARPFVFLNGCHTGRTNFSLTDIGGFAAKFVGCSAGAFLGSYWAVTDKTAQKFAQEMYGRLLQGIPFGRAMRESRLAIHTPQDPSWLAYTLYAHPAAQVGFVP